MTIITEEQRIDNAIQKRLNSFLKRFNIGSLLRSVGATKEKGSLIDATFVEVPRQRNSREENATIKSGQVPKEWKTPENVNKLEQKDTDARWTKKVIKIQNFYRTRKSQN